MRLDLLPLLNIKCAECKCAPLDCVSEEPLKCVNCIKEDLCCCITIHDNGVTDYIQNLFFWFSNFFRHTKKIYAVALGIEILCIAAAQIGVNTSFFLFGYRTHIGIIMGYLLGYSLFSFTTFATILGRYNYVSNNRTVCGCRSVLEQGANVQIFHVRYIHINSFSDYLIKLHLTLIWPIIMIIRYASPWVMQCYLDPWWCI